MCSTINKMLSLAALILACVCMSSVADTDADLESLINEIFGNNQPTTGASACEDIKPEISGCHECYPCNHSSVEWYKKNGSVKNITIYNSKCVPTEMCCVSQEVIIDNRFSGGSSCGKRVHTGRKRPAPRATVQGEYPWLATVYLKSGTQQRQLCAATYIVAGESHALLTSATCVRGRAASSLRASFTAPAGGGLQPVAGVVVHGEFNADLRRNDIALLNLRSASDIPSHVSPLCLPSKRPQHALTCRTVAGNNYLINTFIPKRRVCETARPDIHKSQLCASRSDGDYEPMNGAGLFCESLLDKSTFELHGIALYSKQAITIYSNVSDHVEWINRNL